MRKWPLDDTKSVTSLFLYNSLLYFPLRLKRFPVLPVNYPCQRDLFRLFNIFSLLMLPWMTICIITEIKKDIISDIMVYTEVTCKTNYPGWIVLPNFEDFSPLLSDLLYSSSLLLESRLRQDFFLIIGKGLKSCFSSGPICTSG